MIQSDAQELSLYVVTMVTVEWCLYLKVVHKRMFILTFEGLSTTFEAWQMFL